ncbi:MAG: hypothetical protein OXC66_01300 [Roseovarius sp.]|nr:hypothetical protein [Roseovarius sp.]
MARATPNSGRRTRSVCNHLAAPGQVARQALVDNRNPTAPTNIIVTNMNCMALSRSSNANQPILHRGRKHAETGGIAAN